MDASKIDRVAAEHRRALEERFSDDFEIGDVCTVVQVVGQGQSVIALRNSGMAPHHVIGLLESAKDLAQKANADNPIDTSRL
jgi:hypothetical protein